MINSGEDYWVIDVLIDDLASSDENVISGIITVLGNILSDDILKLCKSYLRGKGYNSILYNSISDDDITKANAMPNVTWSEKIGLIAHASRINFSS